MLFAEKDTIMSLLKALGERNNMKKTYIICIILVLLVLAAGAGTFVLTNNAVSDAEAAHTAVYNDYVQMQNNAAASSLTVTEQGIVVGTYTMEELGVMAQTGKAVEACYGETDRMEPKVFSNLTIKEKLDWNKQDHGGVRSAEVDLAGLDLSPVLADLDAVPRLEAENAYVEFVDGAFLVHEELPGNVLHEENVRQALTQVLTGLTVDNGGMPSQVRLELTDADCYLQPELTVAETFFDFDAMLRDSVKDMTVTVEFHGAVETLKGEQLEELLSANAKGKIQAEEDALKEIIAQWAAKYKESSVPYLLDSYVDGPKRVEILTVDYDVNEEALLALLAEELVELKDVEVEAPWYCWRNGEAFSLGGTYEEIDISNQVMTYYKDGEVFVTTDIVSGATWGYPTPEGFYKVENKDTNCWLSGEDYNVHVDYWVGFIGYQIGLHDASWRTKFGGDNYVMNGSHGCINTPTEAMAKIFENIEVGVPILVYGK